MNTHMQLEDERVDRLRGAVTRLTIGSFILLIGILLLLREAGIIQNRIVLWPWALITFGTLITVGAVDRLRRLERNRVQNHPF